MISFHNRHVAVYDNFILLIFNAMNLAMYRMKKKNVSHTCENRNSSVPAPPIKRATLKLDAYSNIKYFNKYENSRLTIFCTVLVGRFPGDVYCNNFTKSSSQEKIMSEVAKWL